MRHGGAFEWGCLYFCALLLTLRTLRKYDTGRYVPGAPWVRVRPRCFFAVPVKRVKFLTTVTPTLGSVSTHPCRAARSAGERVVRRQWWNKMSGRRP